VTKTVVSKRASLYDDLIEYHASQHSLQSDFVRAVIQAESAFNPFARSIKGAMGLMQLMPGTAAQYRVTNAYDPAQNIRAGVAYLKSLMMRYNDDISLALAAYNAGPGAVQKYGNTVPPYKETRNYVAKIRSNTGPAVPPNQVFKAVQVVEGREKVRYTNKPVAGATVVRPPTAR
jgi:soluble lytic murein transglycosylase-like protein